MSFPRLAHALLNGQPYFGPALRSLQGLPERHGCFLPVVRRCAEDRTGPIAILEIGTWAGASAVSWAKAIETVGCGGSVTCVDRWEPYFDALKETGEVYRDMNEAAESGDVFQLFLHNIRACRVDRMITYHRGASRDVLPKFGPASFDLVYIDGDHAYETVRSDIALAKQVIRPGGIICGDDLELQRSELDGSEHEGHVAAGVDYAPSTKNLSYYHPGVTEAVSAEFGEASVCCGFWALQSRGDSWSRFEIADGPLAVPDHIRDSVESDRVELVSEGADFNFVRVGERFMAFSRSVHSIEPLVDRVGDRDLGNLVLVGNSMAEVWRKAEDAAKGTQARVDRRALEELNRLLIDKFAAADAAGDRRSAEMLHQLEAAAARLDEKIDKLAAVDAAVDRRSAEMLHQLEEFERRTVEHGLATKLRAYVSYLVRLARSLNLRS